MLREKTKKNKTPKMPLPLIKNLENLPDLALRKARLSFFGGFGDKSCQTDFS